MSSTEQFKHDLMEAYIQYQYEQQIGENNILNILDGYDIAEQQIMEEGLWYEETFDMMCDMFGEELC